MNPPPEIEEPFLPRDFSIPFPQPSGSTTSVWGRIISTAVGVFSQRHTHLLFSVFALLLLGNFSYFLLEVPMVRLIERGVCREYHASHPGATSRSLGDIDESLCKLAPIQNVLASIMGWKISFDAVPGMTTPLLSWPRSCRRLISMRQGS